MFIMSKFDKKSIAETEPNNDHSELHEGNEKPIKEKKKNSFNIRIGGWLSSKVTDEQKIETLSDDEYANKAYKLYASTLEILERNTWKEYKKNEGDIVQFLSHEKYGRLFLLTGKIECDASFLFQHFHEQIDKVQEWNKTILESRYIKKINDRVDITYQLMAGVGGGVIKSRDFVNLRYNGVENDCFLTTCASIDYPEIPSSNHLRGENKIGSWCIRPLYLHDPFLRYQCHFQWLMGVDMKGWLPSYGVEMIIPSVMFETISNLRVFCKKNSHLWQSYE